MQQWWTLRMSIKTDVVRRITWYILAKGKILLVIERHFTRLQQGASGTNLHLED